MWHSLCGTFCVAQFVWHTNVQISIKKIPFSTLSVKWTFIIFPASDLFDQRSCEFDVVTLIQGRKKNERSCAVHPVVLYMLHAYYRSDFLCKIFLIGFFV